MQLQLTVGLLLFIGNINLPSLLVVIIIFSIPAFFLLRRVYRKKFGDDKGKVMVWSIVTSILASTVFVVGLLAGILLWLISTE
jgi:hypothetical protein